jgi:hypothetical protein
MKTTIICLFALGCASNPQREAQVVRGAIDAGMAACLVAQAKSVPLTDSQATWCRLK